MKKKLRPLGDILLDMEILLDEMVDDHDLQWGDVRALVMQHLRGHKPGAQEQYVDGGSPVDYYGPMPDKNDALKYLTLLSNIKDEFDVGRPRKNWVFLMEEIEKIQKANKKRIVK